MYRWTGAAGIVAAALLLIMSPLYLMMGTPPPLGDTANFADYVTRSNVINITGKLVEVFDVVGFIVIVVGLRELIRRVRPDLESLAALVFGSGMVAAAAVLVFDALAGGAALDTVSIMRSPCPVAPPPLLAPLV